MVNAKPLAPAGEKPYWNGRSRNQRIASIAVVASSVNILGFVVVGLLGVALNMIAYMVSTGSAGPPHPDHERALPNDWRGHMLIQLPWWVFAVGGLIALVVVVVSWTPSRRFVPPVARATVAYRTSPLFLAFVAAFLAVSQLGVISFYDGLLSPLSPYWVGPVVLILAAVVALWRWQLDPTPQMVRPKRVTEPTIQSFVVAIVHVVNLSAVILLPLAVIVVSQIVYLAAHDGSLPLSDRSAALNNVTMAALWNGHMVVDLPWWFFALGAVILLAIVIYTWPVSHRFEPKGNRRRILFTTSPLFLAAAAVVMFSAQVVQVSFFATPGVAGQPYLTGLALCIAVVALALVLWWWGPGSEELRAANRKPQRQRRGGTRV